MHLTHAVGDLLRERWPYITMKSFEANKPQAFFPLRLLAASRILFFPRLLLRYLKINIWRKLKCETRKHDPMYFLVHKYYLSKRLTVKERIQSAIDHHAYELEDFNRMYESDVYRRIGIIIWERRIDDHRVWENIYGATLNTVP